MIKRKIVCLFALLCVSAFIFGGCGYGAESGGEGNISAVENITVSIGNDGVIECGAEGVSFGLDVTVTGTKDRNVMFIIDEAENFVTVNGADYVLTVAAGVPEGYVFTLTVVSAKDRSKYAALNFTVDRTDIEPEPIGPVEPVTPDPPVPQGPFVPVDFENYSGAPVYLSNGRIQAPDKYLVDDFRAGVNADRWYISTQTWGGLADYQGCKTENVSYTADGILLLKAQGRYSTDIPLSGAAVITRETYGTGSYSVAMKVMPRLGACNALWTYYYGRGGRDNHEIDIELPGHRTPGGGEIGYDRVLNTNWVSETSYTSSGNFTASPANDGKWHLYRFDWHTYPAPRVDYYVDGVLTHSETRNVPSVKGLFWMGVWLPNAWCGQPDFEVDYMMIDWFSFVPFDQPAEESWPVPGGYEADVKNYPSYPVAMPSADYISNGTFEGNAEAWKGGRITGGAYAGNNALSLSGSEYASQKITAVYGGFKYDLSAYAAGTGCIEVTYYARNGSILSTDRLDVDSSDYNKFTKQIIAPEGCDYIVISLKANGNVIYDNVSLKIR
ncbi:MAG: glycoside hydrolase family 16 protein [Clostridia bacterium]|nr:glycoside hydrolase family 16 protein [Clostridia bacterium]